MNRKDLEKTKKLARVTRVICRISIWAAAIGTAILAIAILLTYALPADHIKPLKDSGNLNIFVTGSFVIPAEAFTSMEALRTYLWALLGRVTASVAIYIAAAVHLIGLLKSVEMGEPFALDNVKRLRKIGIVLLIGSVIIPSVSSFTTAVATHTSLLDAKGDSTFDLTLLLCGLLVIVLSGIFAYGARLQREHDQTV